MNQNSTNCFARESREVNRAVVAEARELLERARIRCGADPDLLTQGLMALAAECIAEARRSGLEMSQEMLDGFMAVAWS